MFISIDLSLDSIMIAHNIPTLAMLSMSDAFYSVPDSIDKIGW
jgi:hypothetical protein